MTICESHHADNAAGLALFAEVFKVMIAGTLRRAVACWRFVYGTTERFGGLLRHDGACWRFVYSTTERAGGLLWHDGACWRFVYGTTERAGGLLRDDGACWRFVTTRRSVLAVCYGTTERAGGLLRHDGACLLPLFNAGNFGGGLIGVSFDGGPDDSFEGRFQQFTLLKFVSCHTAGTRAG